MALFLISAAGSWKTDEVTKFFVTNPGDKVPERADVYHDNDFSKLENLRRFLCPLIFNGRVFSSVHPVAVQSAVFLMQGRKKAKIIPDMNGYSVNSMLKVGAKDLLHFEDTPAAFFVDGIKVADRVRRVTEKINADPSKENVFLITDHLFVAHLLKLPLVRPMSCSIIQGERKFDGQGSPILASFQPSF